jgi:hypothetical protein
MKAYQAYAKGDRTTAEASPRAAAVAFFEQHPTRRKCDVIEGTIDGAFFVVSYGRASEGKWPSSWKNVTKKTAGELPDTTEET